MKLKANHELILPDGETKIKVGETFDWDKDPAVFGKCVEIVDVADKKGGDASTNTEEAAIRAQAKALGIANYHNKGIKRLKEDILAKQKNVAGGNDPENKTNEGSNNAGK